MDCKSRLENYLRENDVPFREMTHRAAYTARDVATVQHVAGKQVAKAVMMVADNSMLMVVLPASYRINLNKLGDALGEMTVRFAHEHEFAHLFKDCDVGAMPPFGNLYNLPVYVDRSLSEDEQIVFQASTHCDTMQVAYTDFARLVRPIVVQVAEPVHEAPDSRDTLSARVSTLERMVHKQADQKNDRSRWCFASEADRTARQLANAAVAMTNHPTAGQNRSRKPSGPRKGAERWTQEALATGVTFVNVYSTRVRNCSHTSIRFIKSNLH